jgi:3-dehydroquinate synthase class II
LRSWSTLCIQPCTREWHLIQSADGVVPGGRQEDDDGNEDYEEQLEAAIDAELAKFQQQQEQKYLQLKASGYQHVALPSPTPAQQLLRAVECQPALSNLTGW